MILIFPFSPSQLKTEFLPLLSVIFVSENSLVAAVSIARSPPQARFMLGGILSKCCARVCPLRATTVAPCCSAATTAEHWPSCPNWTSLSRASRGTSRPWSASGTWISEPPLRTATLPWTHCTRTASRESPRRCRYLIFLKGSLRFKSVNRFCCSSTSIKTTHQLLNLSLVTFLLRLKNEVLRNISDSVWVNYF